MQLGEYVSLGKVEARLKTHPLVENICVYGDPYKKFTVALVVPSRYSSNKIWFAIGPILECHFKWFKTICHSKTGPKMCK